MAIKYVKSGASGAADGSTWADAYTSVATAVSAATAGDTIYVSDNHNETASGTITKTGAVTQIICVDDAAEPPTTLATTGIISNTTGLVIHGDLFFYGLTIRHASGGGSSSMTIGQAGNGRLDFEQCVLEAAGGASSNMVIGCNTGSQIHSMLTFRNCNFKYTNTGQYILLGRGRVEFEGCVMPDAGSSAIPTTLFQMNGALAQGMGSHIFFTGCDFSASTGGKTLFGASDCPQTFYLIDCTYSSSLGTLYGSASGSGGAELYLKNTASSNINYGYAVKKYTGTVDIDTVRYVTTGGATDGVTPYSWKVAGNAASKFHAPFRSEWIYKFNGTVDTNVTVTIECLIDAAAAPNDNEVWAEFFYLATSGSPRATFIVDDRMTLLDSSTQAQTAGAGAGTWTKDAPVTGWVSFKCHVTLTTPRKKGYIAARICVGANKTFYVNPDMTLS